MSGRMAHSSNFKVDCRHKTVAETHVPQAWSCGCSRLETSPQLRHAHVAFVHEQNGVFRQVFEQRGRRISRLSTREVTGIVLDSRAVARGFQHFQIESGAFLQSLRFQELAVRSEPLDTIF